MNRNADRLSSGDKKEILGRIDNVDIVLSNGETPETNQAARIRKAARDVLRESLKHVNSRAEAEQLLERTIATMKSFDASLVQLDSQTDSASLRAKIERDALSRGVSGAAVESAEQSSVAQVKKVRTKDGSEVYIVVGGSDSTEKKNVAVAFSRANGNVWVQVAASMGTYYVNGSGERVSLNEIDNGTNIDQPNFTVSPKDAVATSAMPSPSAASSSSSAKSRRSSDSSGTSTHSGPEVSSEGLPSIGRVNLGSDYSGSSYEKSIPVFANRKIVSMDAIKGVKTTVLGQDVLLRNQSGRRAGSLDRGNTVTLTGKIIYMRAIDRATGATVVLPYLDIGNDQYIAAKFVKTASVAATTTTVRPSPTLPGTPGGGSLTPSPTLPGTPGAGGSLTPSPTLPGTPGAGGSLTPSPTLPGTPGAGSPVLSASPVARPAEWRTFVGDMHDLSRRWTYVNDVQSDRNIVDFDAEDLSEAWNTNEVRAVLTSDGVRLMRDEKNHHLIAFADLNKSQFERFAPASLQQKVNDMELILKAAVAYDSAESGGTSRTPKNLYEDFRVALEGYAPGKESVLESVMSNAAIALDERLGGIMTTIKDFLSSGTAHSVKDILAQSDPNARKRMSHEWARYFSHAVTSQTILNDRFDDVTELVGSKMTDADLTAIQAMLGDYGSSAVDNFVGGIRNPSVIADPQQRAACERIAQIFQKYPANERDKAIGIFTKNIYDKIVGLSSEATKYLEVHKQDHHEAIRTKVNEVYGIDINRIPADRSTLNDRERQAAQAWDAAERATAANVKAVFALTAVKSGIFDAAVGLAVQNDSIKRFPDAEMYASIEGKLGDWNISDSTWDMGVSTLAFILPEIIGMAVGMGVGYAAIRLGSGILRGTSGLRAARAAAQGGRLGNMVRLGAEGAVYGYTTYEFGRGIPNVLNGRPWYEGFDSRELAFNVLLGGLYPGVHAITNKFSPFNRILLGQGLGSKTIRFAGNTMIDTGIVMAGGYTVDLMFGAGDWAENDFFQVLAMMPLMRIGMNLSAGSRYRFLVEKGSDGNPAMRVLDPKSALVSDEIVSSLKSLNDAPVGLEIRFPGSTVVKLPNDQFRVTPAGGGGHYDVSVGNFFNPKRWSGLLAEVRRHIPANTTLSGADLAMMSESRMAAKLARELPDSVVLARGYHLKIDNPTAAAADWRYTVKDSSDRVIVSSVDRAALERFATDARGHGASIMTQLRSGAPEIHDGPIRAVVTNPDQLDETLRLCDVYHNNVKIASGIPIAEVDVRLNRVFARLDDALVTNLDDLVGRAATSKSE
ncbi:MAG TPA: hypothetical protein PK765_05190 [bacterium]|nr:hypothetical protein [bacterium]